MGRIVAGVSLLVLSLGIANAEEFIASITKVDGKKITASVVKFDKDSFKKGDFKKGDFKKGDKKDFKGEEKTFTVAADCKFVKRGKFDKDTKKAETTALEGGLKNMLFTDITTEKPVKGRITTNEKGEITEISIGGGKGGGNFKKKKNDTSAD